METGDRSWPRATVKFVLACAARANAADFLGRAPPRRTKPACSGKSPTLASGGSSADDEASHQLFLEYIEASTFYDLVKAGITQLDTGRTHHILQNVDLAWPISMRRLLRPPHCPQRCQEHEGAVPELPPRNRPI